MTKTFNVDFAGFEQKDPQIHKSKGARDVLKALTVEGTPEDAMQLIEELRYQGVRSLPYGNATDLKENDRVFLCIEDHSCQGKPATVIRHRPDRKYFVAFDHGPVGYFLAHELAKALPNNQEKPQ